MLGNTKKKRMNNGIFLAIGAWLLIRAKKKNVDVTETIINENPLRNNVSNGANLGIKHGPIKIKVKTSDPEPEPKPIKNIVAKRTKKGFLGTRKTIYVKPKVTKPAYQYVTGGLYNEGITNINRPKPVRAPRPSRVIQHPSNRISGGDRELYERNNDRILR
jgi:hypothetical protein